MANSLERLQETAEPELVQRTTLSADIAGTFAIRFRRRCAALQPTPAWIDIAQMYDPMRGRLISLSLAAARSAQRWPNTCGSEMNAKASQSRAGGQTVRRSRGLAESADDRT